MHFIVVLFPAPFGPIKPYTVPFSMFKLMSSTPLDLPYVLVKFSIFKLSFIITSYFLKKHTYTIKSFKIIDS